MKNKTIVRVEYISCTQQGIKLMLKIQLQTKLNISYLGSLYNLYLFVVGSCK